MKQTLLRLLLFLLLLCSCTVNSDPAESAPGHALGEECDLDHDHHQHQPGHICSESQWFFTQPWAAQWYWGKLLRDGLILLALASLLTLLSGRRRG